MALPSGYKRLEYIQSSGTQYIDTGFKPNQETELQLDFSFLGSAGSNIAGVRNTSSETINRFGIITFGSTSKIGAFFRNSSISSISIDNNRHTYALSKSGLYVDSILYGSSNSEDFTCTYSLILFGFNNGSDGIAATSNRCYSCKIYDNGTLVRDFIPCQTTSGEIGLWDDASSVFYGNAGTGTFVAGPVMVQPETPAALNVLGATQNAVILVWAAAPVEQSYRLYRDGAVIYDGTDLSYTDHGLAAGSTHAYTVTGVVGTVETYGVTAEAATTSGIVLITDRTEADVSSGRTKGRYNALDLIRVGEAILYAKRILNGDTGFDINVSVKLDWQLDEIPTQAQMHAYLENIRRVRSIVQAYRTTADAPSSMNGLTWGKANDIEAILSDAETLVRDIMLSNHCYSGRTISGVLALP